MDFNKLNPLNHRSKPNKKLFFLSSALVLLLFVGIIYTLTGGFKIEERPPRLPFDSGMFQGLIRIEDDRFFQFTEAEEEFDKLSTVFANAMTREGRKIQYFHSDNEISVEDIIDSIKADADNKFVIAIYRPEISNWYTFPKGPYKDTLALNRNDLDDFMVPAGGGFVIGAEKNFKTINIKHGTQISSDIHFDLANLENGWNLLGVTNDTELELLVDNCYNRVRSIWVQESDEDFDQTESYRPRLKAARHLTWFLMGPEKYVCEIYDPFAGGTYTQDPPPPPAYQGTPRPHVCNPLGDYPVCDVNGNWYSNICFANYASENIQISDFFNATSDGRCLAPYIPSPMPSICNSLVYNPVCDINGNWFRNLCTAKLLDENIVISSEYVAISNELCEIPADPVDPPPEPPCNSLLPVCDIDGNLYGNICLAEDAGVEVDEDGRYEIVINAFRVRSCSPIINCPDNEPVCGVDSVLYANKCEADDAGIKVSNSILPSRFFNDLSRRFVFICLDDKDPEEHSDEALAPDPAHPIDDDPSHSADVVNTDTARDYTQAGDSEDNESPLPPPKDFDPAAPDDDPADPVGDNNATPPKDYNPLVPDDDSNTPAKDYNPAAPDGDPLPEFDKTEPNTTAKEWEPNFDFELEDDSEIVELITDNPSAELPDYNKIDVDLLEDDEDDIVTVISPADQVYDYDFGGPVDINIDLPEYKCVYTSTFLKDAIDSDGTGTSEEALRAAVSQYLLTPSHIDHCVNQVLESGVPMEDMTLMILDDLMSEIDQNVYNYCCSYFN